MTAMHDDEWDDAAGDWRPDEWDAKARAVIEYRDRIADSVPGPAPEVGTAEWAAADWRTQTAAYARHERDVAAAQGRAISNRMAEESGRRRDLVESSRAISAEYARRGYANDYASHEELQRRRSEVVIPLQRTAASVARAREACQAAERQEPAAAEEPPAAGAALERGR